jgi:hypothetical protein
MRLKDLYIINTKMIERYIFAGIGIFSACATFFILRSKPPDET